MRKHILNLLILLLVALTFPAKSIELHIPAKPTGEILDYANIMKADDLGLLSASLTLQKVKQGNTIYILTVPEDYVSQLDTFSRLVARSWGICDTDRSSLLILAAGRNTYAYFKVSPYDERLNDTVASYISTDKFQLYLIRSNSLAISEFLDDLGDGKYDPETIEKDISYIGFKKTYNSKTPYIVMLTNNAPPPIGKYFLLLFLAIIIIAIVIVFIRRRKKTTPTTVTNPPSSQLQKQAINLHKPNQKKPTNHANQNLAAGTAGLAAGALLAADLLDDSGDDGGRDDDDSSSYDDSSSSSSSDYSSSSDDTSTSDDYSNDSSDYSSGSSDYSSDSSSSDDY